MYIIFKDSISSSTSNSFKTREGTTEMGFVGKIGTTILIWSKAIRYRA